MLRKWYFALNEVSLKSNPPFWRSMINVAVKSAIRKTPLIPNIIYDGPESEFTHWLRSLGVRVVHHRLSFYDALVAHHNANPAYSLQTAAGAFLRTELPLLETQDDFVLYTDCDVMFARDPNIGLSLPSVFACAAEWNRSFPRGEFNTGVMVMNLPALRCEFSAFKEYISNNLGNFIAYDQDAYQHFYVEKVERLPDEYNWKPYWGISDQPKIVHFHGPKPSHTKTLIENPEAEMPEIYTVLFKQGPDGYRHYLSQWETMSASSNVSWFERAKLKIRRAVL